MFSFLTIKGHHIYVSEASENLSITSGLFLKTTTRDGSGVVEGWLSFCEHYLAFYCSILSSNARQSIWTLNGRSVDVTALNPFLNPTSNTNDETSDFCRSRRGRGRCVFTPRNPLRRASLVPKRKTESRLRLLKITRSISGA